MGWKLDASGGRVVDGKPFDPPADAFERAYNLRLLTEPEACSPNDLIIDPDDGWPLPSGLFERREPADLRSSLDWYFHSNVQKSAARAGNPPSELEAIAKRLLGYAALHNAPVTASERRIAKRLGIDLAGNPTRTLRG